MGGPHGQGLQIRKVSADLARRVTITTRKRDELDAAAAHLPGNSVTGRLVRTRRSHEERFARRHSLGAAEICAGRPIRL
jgi:hypothetical protein